MSLEGLAARVRSILRPGDVESRLDEEFRFHLETETEHLIREGVPPAEARRRAMLAFGAVEGYREAMRDERGARWFDDLRADVRYAVKGMRRNPGFILAVTLTLGLGIGVNGIIFGYVNTILFRPVPDRRPRSSSRCSPATPRPAKPARSATTTSSISATAAGHSPASRR